MSRQLLQATAGEASSRLKDMSYISHGCCGVLVTLDSVSALSKAQSKRELFSGSPSETL